VQRTPATEAERVALGTPELREVSRGAGCDACRGSGSVGRTGVYELLVLDAAMRTAVTSGEGATAVRDLMRASGMPVLRDDGARLVIEGVTTPEEVLRVCRG
jgi:type II secretory ATPase GspE/PulE/Tfp pilus assembly ATPase PilB-like protein